MRILHVAVVLAILITIGAGWYIGTDYLPMQARIDDLVSSGAFHTRYEAGAFDDKYSGWARNNDYNDTVTEKFAPLWVSNSTVADMIAENEGAEAPEGMIFRVAEIIRDNPGAKVETPRQWTNYGRLVAGLEKVTNPEIYAVGAVQAEAVMYGSGMPIDDWDFAWSLAIPTQQWMVDRIYDGRVSIANHSREEIGRLLMPIELTYMDIQSGGTGHKTMTQWERNVVPNSRFNGSSPRDWLVNTVHGICDTKGARYERAILEGSRRASPWPNSLRYHQKAVQGIIDEDDLSVFIFGNAGIHNEVYEDGKKSPALVNIIGQHCPDYAVLVGNCFGRVVLQQKVIYPHEPIKTLHTEPAVKTTRGDYIGLYTNLDAFALDYIGSKYEPLLYTVKPNGESADQFGRGYYR